MVKARLRPAEKNRPFENLVLYLVVKNPKHPGRNHTYEE